MQTQSIPSIEPAFDDEGKTPLPPAPLGPGPEPGDVAEALPLPIRIIACAVLIALALVCALGVAPAWSSTEHFEAQIQTLDEKKNNVLGLVTTTTVASTALSAIPGDTATPLAEKLADLSSDLLIVLAVIYLEKFLITTLSYVSLTWLLPFALAVYGLLALLYTTNLVPNLRSTARRIAWISLVFGIMLATVIPASIWVTDRIDQTYEESMVQAIDASDLVGSEDATSDDATGAGADSSADSTSDGSSIFDKITNFFEDTAETITESAQGLSDSAISTITQLVDSMAVMIVTSCLIPLLVLVVFFWIAKTVAGIDLGPVSQVFGRAHGAGRRAVSGVHQAADSRRMK